MNYIPWSEKYRPDNFNKIILNNYNKIFFENILKNNNFPNLLLYGPPGTGKTTTIINLINEYQTLYYEKNKELIIHLNASDERGIDIIRNNIFNFVNTNNLFTSGLKFVILDEVDYMTRTAQQGLKCLIQEYNSNIRYCLICNYISKIDYSLQYEFIKVRFNQLPKSDIFKFIVNIIENEKINLSHKCIEDIITYFDNDIRSMINYIQSNIYKKICFIDNNLLNKLYEINMKNSIKEFETYITYIENKCNINKPYIVNKYLFYIINNKFNTFNYNIICELEFIIHNADNNICTNYIYSLVKKTLIHSSAVSGS